MYKINVTTTGHLDGGPSWGSQWDRKFNLGLLRTFLVIISLASLFSFWRTLKLLEDSKTTAIITYPWLGLAWQIINVDVIVHLPVIYIRLNSLDRIDLTASSPKYRRVIVFEGNRLPPACVYKLVTRESETYHGISNLSIYSRTAGYSFSGNWCTYYIV